jgi:hypothetical protein
MARLLCMQPVDIMALPYQCLVARNESTEAEVKWTLFGASGPKLVAQSSNGTTSVWPEQDGRVSVSNAHRLVYWMHCILVFRFCVVVW